MTIKLTQRHNEARLAGSLSDLDLGPNKAKLRLYGGTRPANAATAPGTDMLVEIELTKPSGTIANGMLSLTQNANGLIAVTGQATWARFVNGNGDTCFDADAGKGTGAWEVQLANDQLYAGGEARLVSAVLG